MKARRTPASASQAALAAATGGLCHSLRRSGRRRKGVHVARHMLPFWRGDELVLERFVELWIGDEGDDG